MKYFLILDKDTDNSNEYKIVKVQDEDIPSFLVRHRQEFIHEGNSVAEILMELASNLEHTKT